MFALLARLIDKKYCQWGGIICIVVHFVVLEGSEIMPWFLVGFVLTAAILDSR